MRFDKVRKFGSADFDIVREFGERECECVWIWFLGEVRDQIRVVACLSPSVRRCR